LETQKGSPPYVLVYTPFPNEDVNGEKEQTRKAGLVTIQFFGRNGEVKKQTARNKTPSKKEEITKNWYPSASQSNLQRVSEAKRLRRHRAELCNYAKDVPHHKQYFAPLVKSEP